jgi:hypothetical protein
VAFTARLSSDVDAIVHDKHLQVWSLAAGPPHPATAAPVPRNEAGIVRADWLAGGIGYIQITAFFPKPMFKEAIDKVMTSLKGCRALIIDDRGNHGGQPDSVAYLVSFLVARGTPINTIVSRTPMTTTFTRETHTAEATPENFGTIPVYVLTSHATISAGEELAYDLQALHRATIIGEVTAGGANPAMGIALPHGAIAGIPYGRAENPVTKDNWEGRGVRPDVTTSEADALQVALERLGQKPFATIEQAQARQLFKPRTTPRPSSALRLRQLLAGYASGHLDYAAMSPDFAAQAREEAPRLQSALASLGAVKALKFVDIDKYGQDRFEVTFAHGMRVIGILTGPDDKIFGTSNFVSPPAGG